MKNISPPLAFRLSRFSPDQQVELSSNYVCDPMVVGNLTIPAGTKARVVYVDLGSEFIALKPVENFRPLKEWDYELHIMADDRGCVPLIAL